MQHFDRLFRSAEVEAEALIGIARMLVATILGLAAFVLIQRAGMPTDPNTVSEVYHSLTVLSLYFGLGVLSVGIVKLGLYRTWIAWVLAVAEVILIAVNIYTDLNSAGASSFAALSSPAGYLLAVFLVLQTLRYRLVFQITTSLLLVSAVIGLLQFNPGAGNAPDEPTLRYLTSNYAGIPNLVSIIMLLLVISIAALSVWRGRKLIHGIADEVEVRANQKRFLPGELADQMTNADISRLRAGRLANLVIMFVDIRGFTALSESFQPAEISTFLSEYRSRITRVVAAHDGVVDKFIGDGALIVFGLEEDPASAAGNAIAAGKEALAELERWNDLRTARNLPPISVVIAVHAGEVMVGAIGDEERLEFSVIGAPVNEASRLEAVAKAEDAVMVVSEQVLGNVLDSDRDTGWKPLGDVALRGTSHPTKLFALRD